MKYWREVLMVLLLIAVTWCLSSGFTQLYVSRMNNTIKQYENRAANTVNFMNAKADQDLRKVMRQLGYNVELLPETQEKTL